MADTGGAQLTGNGTSASVMPQLMTAVVLLGHAAGLLVWQQMMPQGFPAGHRKWWTNSILPMIGIAVCTGGAAAVCVRSGRRFTVLSAYAVAMGWVGIGTALTAVLWRSSSAWSALILAPGLYMMWRLRNQAAPVRSRAVIGVSLFTGFVFGILMVVLQLAGISSTLPANVASPAVVRSANGAQDPGIVPLGTRTIIDEETGSVRFLAGALRLHADSLLTFESKSPERFWTVFSPLRVRRSAPLSFDGRTTLTDGMRFAYRSEGSTVLDVRETSAGVAGESVSSLGAPIYSHLNSYMWLAIDGHSRLFLSFSPCQNERIEV